jgi:hypothetical protein
MTIEWGRLGKAVLAVMLVAVIAGVWVSSARTRVVDRTDALRALRQQTAGRALNPLDPSARSRMVEALSMTGGLTPTPLDPSARIQIVAALVRTGSLS